MILLTDYSPTYLQEAKKYLEKIGFKVIAVDNSRELIKTFVNVYLELEAVFYDKDRISRDCSLQAMLNFMKKQFKLDSKLFVDWSLMDALEGQGALLTSDAGESAA